MSHLWDCYFSEEKGNRILEDVSHLGMINKPSNITHDRTEKREESIEGLKDLLEKFVMKR